MIGRKQLASGKGKCSKANLLRTARTWSYPDAKLSRREATQTRSYPESRIYMILWRIYPKAELKAKLNSTTMAMFVLQIPPIKAIQSILKSEPLQTFENFEGGLVDTLKKTRF